MYAHYKPLTMQCLHNNDTGISTNDKCLCYYYILVSAYVMPMYAQRVPTCIPTLVQSKPMFTCATP